MNVRVPFKLAGVLSLIFLFENNVLAQGNLLPSTVLPEKVSQGVTEQQPIQPEVTQAQFIQPTEDTETPVGAEAAKIKFQLNGIILEGNTVYTTQQLELLYRDKLDRVITVGQLFEIIQAITNYYRNNGYILSRAILPPQHVKGGIVRIRIIEGYLASVSVGGNPKGAKCITLAYGRKIIAERPLQLSRMEKYLLIANETPATTVKAVISPSKNLPGAADLTLMTTNHPVTGYLSYDNYGTRYIGPLQVTGNLAVNSIIASGDSLQSTVTKTTKGKQLTYVDINYGLPLWDEGIRALIGGTRARTHPMFVLSPLKIDGINDNYYLILNYPIIRARSQTLTVRSGFNWVDSDVTSLGEKLYTDHVRSIDLGASYNFSDAWAGANLVSGDIRQGLPIFNYTTDTSLDAETSHPGGHAVYTKFAATVSRLQSIYQSWSIYGLFTGQYAFDPLLASEQFAFGGSQLGRGYDVAEIIGDRGVAGSIELRYDWNINRFWLQNIQFYAFYDIGTIWNILEIPDTPTKASATSAGAGFRFFMTKYVSGNLMWTQPLTRKVAAEALVGQGKDPRVFFSVIASFA